MAENMGVIGKLRKMMKADTKCALSIVMCSHCRKASKCDILKKYLSVEENE